MATPLRESFLLRVSIVDVGDRHPGDRRLPEGMKFQEARVV